MLTFLLHSPKSHVSIHSAHTGHCPLLHYLPVPVKHSQVREAEESWGLYSVPVHRLVLYFSLLFSLSGDISPNSRQRASTRKEADGYSMYGDDGVLCGRAAEGLR